MLRVPSNDFVGSFYKSPKHIDDGETQAGGFWRLLVPLALARVLVLVLAKLNKILNKRASKDVFPDDIWLLLRGAVLDIRNLEVRGIYTLLPTEEPGGHLFGSQLLSSGNGPLFGFS